MCKIRIVHFSSHDVRTPIATHPFSDTPSNADFIAPNLIHRCDCTLNAASLLDLPENRAAPGTLPLNACPWHNCCLIWYQAVLCRWYWDNREALGLNLDDEQPEPETRCPNCFVVGEYHPIRMVLDLEQSIERWGDGWEYTTSTSGLPVREGGDKLPSFPAEELFYSREIIDADQVGAESAGLHEDRMRVPVLGQKLRTAKEQLKKAIFVACAALDSLEDDLGMGEGIKRIVDDPAFLLLRLREAQDLVREVRYAEVMSALAFGDLMESVGFVLTALNKMPGEGHSVTSRDGLYSVSRDQLNMAELEATAIADACDGPLKQSPELRERLRVIKDNVGVFRRRETATSSSNRRRMSSGTPIRSSTRAVLINLLAQSYGVLVSGSLRCQLVD
ncbi:uncharacterized protein B0T15DRAFT_511558 [Chaetomium strumarium]|uniref:Uncharacterized protein n=1 Tax=Chaetomium strumarium TaxID=1170767 RepID=A0AAJ0GT48_9PEZI|nr:hypothetical protein B0T15DRAFT_511558 [Chaetomium strumarium]